MESFDDRECDIKGIPPTETPTATDETPATGSPDVQSDNTIVGATVGGVISVAVVIAITVLVFAILVLKRRHAELSIKNHTRLVL